MQGPTMSIRLCLLAFLICATLPAHAQLDAECNAKFATQLQSLEAGFAQNKAEFDSAIDAIISKYAASHPAATKADYRSTFDEVLGVRLAASLQVHENLVRGYRAVVDGQAEPPAGGCKVPLGKMNRETKKTIARNKAIYEDFARQVAAFFPT
jgi:hypothetical protein